MKSLLFSFMLIASFSSAQAAVKRVGGHDGGGGQGIVCYNPQEEIESVELLDFYEGKILEGLNIPEYEGEPIEILAKASNRFPFLKGKNFLEEMTQTFSAFRFLPSGVRLKEIDDGNVIYHVPRDCKIEQIANFQGVSRIVIVKDFWEKLSPTHKAGLILHERFWYEERSQGVRHSARVKRNVARIFSDNLLLEKQEPRNDFSDVVNCHTEFGKNLTLFSLDRDGNVVFSYLGGERVFLKYSLRYQPHPNPDFQDLKLLFKILTNPSEPLTFPEISDQAVVIGSLYGLDVFDSEGQNVATVTMDWQSGESTPLKMNFKHNEFEGLFLAKNHFDTLSCTHYPPAK